QGGGEFQFTVRVTDDGVPAQSQTVVFSINVNELNSSPLQDELPNATARLGQPFATTAVATDVDLPTQLVRYSLGPNSPAGVSIGPFTGVVTWTPTSQQIGQHSITVIAQDDGSPSRSAKRTFQIEVLSGNSAPTDILLSNTVVNENVVGPIIGQLTAVDPDSGDSHTFTVDDARFEIAGNQLKLKSGQSLDFEAEPQLSVVITATDAGGLSVTATIGIEVTNVNDPPTVQTPLVDQPATQYRPFEFTIPANTFTDEDGDALALSVKQADGSELPAWLTFDPLSGKLSGFPAVGTDGSLALQVIATDNGSPAASGVSLFELQIAANVSPWQNEVNRLNVNNDSLGDISPTDVLVVINYLNLTGAGELPPPTEPVQFFLDVNGDNQVSPIDALLVINYLNQRAGGEGEDEQQAAVTNSPTPTANPNSSSLRQNDPTIANLADLALSQSMPRRTKSDVWDRSLMDLLNDLDIPGDFEW
ncbi:MAG: putative Ig domain-containing protein, partial [Planctomycetales bacterium]|nr:putative Ig domain-containing protein [Planctomycetales bacterium]